MFNKSLLAISVFAASAAVSATTLTTYTGTNPASVGTSVAEPKISTQGFAALTAPNKFFTPGAVGLMVSTGEGVNAIDHVQIDLTGADLKDTTAVFNLRTSDGTVVDQLDATYTFDVTDSVKVDGFAGGVSDGSYITMESAKIIPSAVSTGSESSIKMVLNSSLTKIDEATATLATFIDQFKLTVTDSFGADGEKIDVQTDAKALTTASDAFTIVLDSLPVTYKPFSSAVSVSGTVSGDFDWALNASGAISAGVSYAANTYAISSESQVLNATFAPGASANSASYTLTVTPSAADGTGSLSTNAYSANVGVYDAATGEVELLAPSKFELGSWELNGSEVAVPYMPFGLNFASAISVTNTGSFTGDIMVSFTANGVTSDLETIGTSTGMSVVNVGSAVSALAISKGLSQAQVNIVVKAPSDDIKVTAIYYAKGDGDRVNVTPVTAAN